MNSELLAQLVMEFPLPQYQTRLRTVHVNVESRVSALVDEPKKSALSVAVDIADYRSQQPEYWFGVDSEFVQRAMYYGRLDSDLVKAMPRRLWDGSVGPETIFPNVVLVPPSLDIDSARQSFNQKYGFYCPPITVRSPRETVLAQLEQYCRGELRRPIPVVERQVEEHGGELVIDLDSVKANAMALFEEVDPAVGVRFVVKNNGYTHDSGLVHGVVQEAAMAADPVNWTKRTSFAVFNLAEARSLKQAGCVVDVMVLNSEFNREELDELGPLNLIFRVTQAEDISKLCRLIPKGQLRLALELETGMGRGAAVETEWPTLFAELRRRQAEYGFELELFTHCPNAARTLRGEDGYGPTPEDQLVILNRGVELAARCGLNVSRVHMANSATMRLEKKFHRDLVRPGTALFSPLASEGAESKYVSAASYRSRLTELPRYRKGDPIGYESKAIAERDCLGGVLPVGLAQALPEEVKTRVYFPRIQAWARVAAITMNQTIVMFEEFDDGTPICLPGITPAALSPGAGSAKRDLAELSPSDVGPAEFFGEKVSLEKFGYENGVDSIQLLSRIASSNRVSYVRDGKKAPSSYAKTRSSRS